MPRAVMTFSSCSTSAMRSSTTTTPPQGALDVLATLDSSDRWLSNVLVLHSLSKRSSAAGLRSGFAVADRRDAGRAQSRALERHGVHAAAVARRGDGAVVGGWPRRGDARAAQGAQGHGRPAARRTSRATTGRPAAFSCGSRSTTESRSRSGSGATSPSRCSRERISPNPIETARTRGTASSGSPSSMTPRPPGEGLARLAGALGVVPDVGQRREGRRAPSPRQAAEVGLNSRAPLFEPDFGALSGRGT